MIAERGLAGVCPLHVSPVWESCPPAELASWILADRLPVRLTLQQHKILWGEGYSGGLRRWRARGFPALEIQSGLLFEAWSPTLDLERRSDSDK